MPEGIDVERLGQRLRRVRKQKDLTLNDLFEATGISVATLSRIENGGSKEVDARTLVTLAEWMGLKPAYFKSDAMPPLPKTASSVDSTPEVVELYLRADKNLDKETAVLLSKMFRTAYESLAKEPKKK
jgi:transcriptional regulator with XRE-family HTH domain